LPSYDTILSTLSKQGAWWNSFRQKVQTISQAVPIEDLSAFAARVYTSGNPAEIGTLAIAYARSSTDKDHLYALIDRIVVSDLTYGATLEGMECLVLLAKTYTDIGQPKKAWFLWKRGMAMAQLMVILSVAWTLRPTITAQTH
jgi:hypothetical protein